MNFIYCVLVIIGTVFMIRSYVGFMSSTLGLIKYYKNKNAKKDLKSEIIILLIGTMGAILYIIGILLAPIAFQDFGF